MSESGRKRLFDIAKAVREKVNNSGDAIVNRKGLLLVELMARDLTGENGMPGIKLWRDSPSKFRLQRGQRNAEITLEWQKDILAAALICEKHGEPKTMVRYVYDEASDSWRRLEGQGEIYEDMSHALVEYLYPEARPTRTP